MARTGSPRRLTDRLMPVIPRATAVLTIGSILAMGVGGVAVSSAAVVLAPFTVGALADAVSIRAASWLVPVTVVLASAALAALLSRRTRPSPV